MRVVARRTCYVAGDHLVEPNNEFNFEGPLNECPWYADPVDPDERSKLEKLRSAGKAPTQPLNITTGEAVASAAGTAGDGRALASVGRKVEALERLLAEERANNEELLARIVALEAE